MSTRQEGPRRLLELPATAGSPGFGVLDPGEAVALVTRSRRGLLLGVHRHRLGREDLEDCYSQATLELLARARDGSGFASPAHIGKALEQRFLSRIHDRRRALSGRSPIEAAIATAASLEDCGVEIVDPRADVERLALMHEDLRLISDASHELSPDQRLLLRSQLSCDMACADFCRKHGWSAEKYRKVSQRARARLTRTLDRRSDDSDSSVPFSASRRIREQGPTYDHPSPHT